MRRRVDLLNFINTIAILQELNNNEREKLADCFIKQVFPDGSAIINQGDVGDKF